MTSFEETPVVVGQAPTTYGEIRYHAKGTQALATAEDIAASAAANPELLAGAMRGMALTIQFLLDTIEELTNNTQKDDAA